MNRCNLIPDKLFLSDYDGDFKEYDKAVYYAFLESFDNKTLFYDGMEIKHKYHPEMDGKSYTYYHITSSAQDFDENNRFADLRRYETIKWPSFILEYCKDYCSNVKVWENRRGSKHRVLFYCEDIEYLVILDRRSNFFVFWTAYPVNQPHTKRKLLKEYNKYLQTKAAQ